MIALHRADAGGCVLGQLGEIAAAKNQPDVAPIELHACADTSSSGSEAAKPALYDGDTVAQAQSAGIPPHLPPRDAIATLDATTLRDILKNRHLYDAHECDASYLYDARRQLTRLRDNMPGPLTILAQNETLPFRERSARGRWRYLVEAVMQQHPTVQAAIERKIARMERSPQQTTRLEAETLRMIRPSIIRVNRIFRDPDDPRRVGAEFDAETRHSIVETTRSSSGKSAQVTQRLQSARYNFDGKPVIVMARAYSQQAGRRLEKRGAVVARNEGELQSFQAFLERQRSAP